MVLPSLVSEIYEQKWKYPERADWRGNCQNCPIVVLQKFRKVLFFSLSFMDEANNIAAPLCFGVCKFEKTFKEFASSALTRENLLSLMHLNRPIKIRVNPVYVYDARNSLGLVRISIKQSRSINGRSVIAEDTN